MNGSGATGVIGKKESGSAVECLFLAVTVSQCIQSFSRFFPGLFLLNCARIWNIEKLFRSFHKCDEVTLRQRSRPPERLLPRQESEVYWHIFVVTLQQPDVTPLPQAFGQLAQPTDEEVCGAPPPDVPPVVPPAGLPGDELGEEHRPAFFVTHSESVAVPPKLAGAMPHCGVAPLQPAKMNPGGDEEDEDIGG